jgi:hypothetical protein
MTTEENDNDDDDEENENEFKKKWISVIGYNSAKFDFVLLLPFLQGDKWEIVNSGFIGSPTKAKQVIVKHKFTKVQLRFLDLLMYMPGDNLKGLVTTFGDKNKANKGIFPYDTLDITIDSNENRYQRIQKKLNEILCNKDVC